MKLQARGCEFELTVEGALAMSKFMEALTKYRTTYRRSQLPDLLVSEPYMLSPSSDQPEHALCWPREFPTSKRVGVYAIFGQADNVLYVGRSWLMGRRLCDYFGGGTKPDLSMNWSEPPAFIVTVAVPEKMEWEAAGLEEFLIDELDPPDNTRIRLRRIET
jgi:hypothetical protein